MPTERATSDVCRLRISLSRLPREAAGSVSDRLLNKLNNELWLPGEEAAAAQAVARTAQAEAAQATQARDSAESQLRDLRARLAAAERAQDRLDAITVSTDTLPRWKLHHHLGLFI